MARTIHVKRAYEPAAKSDGYRVLVDRVWPRGVSKDEIRIDEWAKEIAPSTKLRQWFGHDPQRWTEFQKRYRDELRDPAQRQRLRDLLAGAKGSRAITLVYSAKDEEHNQAIVLCSVLERLEK